MRETELHSYGDVSTTADKDRARRAARREWIS